MLAGHDAKNKVVLVKDTARKVLPPTGVLEIDRLTSLHPCTIEDYVAGVSAYVRLGSTIAPGPKKAAQIRLSNALAKSLAAELEARIPRLKGRLVTEERKVAGGLRAVKADLSESHSLDGLRLAVELKPVNLAVGRAIWNRFGDLRTFAVNLHLKFPFAVVGGVLVLPTYEEVGTKAARQAEIQEVVEAAEATLELTDEDFRSAPRRDVSGSPARKPTMHLIERAIGRLVRAGGRASEAGAHHLLEGIAVVVYDPDSGLIDEKVPPPGSGLRWEECVDALVGAYGARFED